jgi:sugar (pentulose or hexulose) kinase
MKTHLQRSALLLTAAALAAGCVQSPPVRREPPPPRAEQPPPPPSPDVYFYPQQGQSTQQQSRDRYECYLWAHQKTGFDPSQPRMAARPNVRVVAVPGPGHDTAVGAVSGAVLGAAVSRPRDAGAGAVIGAVAGAVIGAASDGSRQHAADEEQARLDEIQARRAAQADAQLQSYRRALKACLEGRGYTVE